MLSQTSCKAHQGELKPDGAAIFSYTLRVYFVRAQFIRAPWVKPFGLTPFSIKRLKIASGAGGEAMPNET